MSPTAHHPYDTLQRTNDQVPVFPQFHFYLGFVNTFSDDSDTFNMAPVTATGTVVMATGPPSACLLEAGVPTNYQSLTMVSSNDPGDDRLHVGEGCRGGETIEDKNDDGKPDRGNESRVEGNQGNGQGAPGGFGENGLLAIPHVKTLIILSFTVQVGTKIIEIWLG